MVTRDELKQQIDALKAAVSKALVKAQTKVDGLSKTINEQAAQIAQLTNQPPVDYTAESQQVQAALNELQNIAPDVPDATPDTAPQS